VLFLYKTHLAKAKAENLKRRLECDYFIFHESDGCSVGLLLIWKKKVVQCHGISQYYIDVVIHDVNEWRVMGIYGEPSWDQKERTWEALRSL
jgi:hypothetical protein